MVIDTYPDAPLEEPEDEGPSPRWGSESRSPSARGAEAWGGRRTSARPAERPLGEDEAGQEPDEERP